MIYHNIKSPCRLYVIYSDLIWYLEILTYNAILYAESLDSDVEVQFFVFFKMGFGAFLQKSIMLRVATLCRKAQWRHAHAPIHDYCTASMIYFGGQSCWFSLGKIRSTSTRRSSIDLPATRTSSAVVALSSFWKWSLEILLSTCHG